LLSGDSLRLKLEVDKFLATVRAAYVGCGCLAGMAFAKARSHRTHEGNARCRRRKE
jgi:hypothetical protein